MSYLLDDLDNRILAELRSDGRRSNASIARAIGAAEGTVRRRINRLIKSGAATVFAAINPLKMGYRVEIMLSLRVQPGKLESAARNLARYEEVEYIGLLTGDFDILVRALFRSNDEVYDFIAHKVSHVEGIVSTHTAYVLKIVKRSRFLFPVGDESEREITEIK